MRLPYRSYACNRATFESFLELEAPASSGRKLVAFVTNPFHHTNTTAITDVRKANPIPHHAGAAAVLIETV